MALVSSQKCNDCEKEKGLFFCYDCKHVLCQECRPKHNRIPALKTHTITALDVIDRSAYTLRSECTSHNQECCLYCSNCKILTCTQCVTDNHKTHVFVDISAVASEARKSTEDYISKIKEKISNLSENITKVKSVHIKKLEEEAEKVLCKINCTSKNLTRVIDSQTDISKTNVEDWRNLEKADVEVHLKSLEQMYKVHTKLCDELENMLREKHDKSFFLYFQKLKTDCENLQEVPEDIDFNDIEEFDTNTFVHHVTAMIVETFSIRDYGRTTELKEQITDKELELVALHESSAKRIKAVTEENTTVKQKLEQSKRRIKTLVEENSKFKRQQELDYGRTTELKQQITDNKLELVALQESSEKRIKAVTEENTTVKQKLEQSERRIRTLVEENSKFKRQQELDYGRTTELKEQITDNKLELVALHESSEKRIKAVTEENTNVKQKLEQSERRIKTLVEENSKFKRQQELLEMEEKIRQQFEMNEKKMRHESEMNEKMRQEFEMEKKMRQQSDQREKMKEQPDLQEKMRQTSELNEKLSDMSDIEEKIRQQFEMTEKKMRHENEKRFKTVEAETNLSKQEQKRLEMEEKIRQQSEMNEKMRQESDLQEKLRQQSMEYRCTECSPPELKRKMDDTEKILRYCQTCSKTTEHWNHEGCLIM